jgi:hypothetical protein
MQEKEFRVIIFRKTVIEKLFNPRIQPGLNNHYFLSLFKTDNQIKQIFGNYYENINRTDIEKYKPNRIFNYYEYYFTYLEGNDLKKFLYEIHNNNLNDIEKLLYYYYNYIITLYLNNSSKEEEEIMKAKKNFENNIKDFDPSSKLYGFGGGAPAPEQKIFEEINQIRKKIAKYLKLLSNVYEFKYRKQLFLNNKDINNIFQIIDYKDKNFDINEEDLKDFKEILIKNYHITKFDHEKLGIILRLFYLEKNYLVELKKDINSEITIFYESITNDYYRKYIYIYNYKKINIKKKNEEKKIEKFEDFQKLKKTYFNELIDDDKISKNLIKISLYIIETICFPLSDILVHLTMIYNGLICKNYSNETIKLDNNDNNQILIQFLNFLKEDNNLKFKLLIFEQLYEYLNRNYDIYRIKKLRNIPYFHLLILKIFLWRLNIEKKNCDEILRIYYKFRVLLLKLNTHIVYDEIFEIYLLIYEIVGDTYLNLKYYRKAENIYKSMKRNLNEYNYRNKNNNLFKIIEHKITICKYFCGKKRIKKI